MSQVVTISLDGTVSGLQVKPGKGLDLTKIGLAEVERVSLVEWSSACQGWYVSIIDGPRRGTSLTRGVWLSAGLSVASVTGLVQATDSLPPTDDDLLIFESYDDGVRAEIEFLDHIRVQGEF